MLVLTRKIGERILIDGGISITVVDIGRGRVRLGFKAPKSVNILREEIPRRREVQDADGDKAGQQGGDGQANQQRP